MRYEDFNKKPDTDKKRPQEPAKPSDAERMIKHTKDARDYLSKQVKEQFTDMEIAAMEGGQEIPERTTTYVSALRQVVAEGYGKYYCSTDKRWKERKGPKQTRQTEAANPAQQAAIAIAKKKKQGVVESNLKEFAPNSSEDGSGDSRDIDPLREKIYSLLMTKLSMAKGDSQDIAMAAMEVADDIASESEFVDFTQLPKWVNMVLNKVQGVAEAGPFSYGAKPPRKGSVAYNDLMKRKEQDRKRVKDIEAIGTKNHHVGVAKVTKDVAESTEQSLQKKIQAKRDALGLAREQRRARGQHQQGQREIKLQAEIDELSNQLTQMKKQGVAESADLDAQAMDIATKLTTGKNLEKLRGMVHDSTVYRALDRYFAKYNIPETIYNRVANIVFKKINQQGVAEDISSTKKKISKYEELALAANRAGDDAKCKQYQQKIQVLKQKMSQGVAEGYTGRETKDGTWRVFKDGQAVAVAGPFNSRDEAHAWIKKHKQSVSEAKSLKKRVRVVQGEHAGKTGWIREIKHGIHSTAPKRYYVDIDGGGQANNLPASALRLLKNQSDSQKGMAEATGDNKFDAMMGNIKKSAPVSVTGYVAVEYASENKSDRIKGVTLKGKPMPSSVDVDDLEGEIEFQPDEIERHLIKIGRDNGWSIIDPGHGRGYSELFFDTNANYTSDNQSILAKNIVNTVNEINKFFSGLNSSLQSTGLPGYRVAVWQEISSSNGQKIGDINQIKQIALTKVVNSPNDPGELIGQAILRELPKAEEDGDGYAPEDFAYARKIAKIYITKGERAGLKAQLANRRMIHVSDLIDELLSHAGIQKYRTLKYDDLDEQGVAESDDKWSVEYKGKDYECYDQDHAINKARKFLGYDREKNACIIKHNGKPVYSWRQGEKIESLAKVNNQE